MSEFGNNLEEDPAAEFLAREQADLAGIVDEDVTAAINTEQLQQTNGLPETNGISAHPAVPREEPEKIRKWRGEQKKLIEQKDAQEEVRKKELREEAQKELEEWYVRYREQIEKAKQTNRNAEKEYVAEKSSKGEEWEGIAKMCDFNPKSARHTKDVSRMKSMILQLKQAPPNTTSKA
ncbi:clathrin light chain B isoform X2 [Galendromus occidentalis]|uniref:Clathrin light chain n=1 Tax=Galendromus occidentalis TaxID=34638 RepID=A0AAJ7PB31_9ACAR|nr:clathrin light chain B isoform X2 [Galendromus occidentalis]